MNKVVKLPPLIGEYDNGNYHVKIYEDGTKIRETEYDNFIPEFPECIDMNITNKCDGYCSFCYINGSTDGSHCNFERYGMLLDSIHPYTEIAINGNDLSHPGLNDFLIHMKNRHVLVNITINQHHFIKYIDRLHQFTDSGLVYGIGVSLVDASDFFISKVKEFKNIVVHIIAGITSPIQIAILRNHNIPILILGYKKVGRGSGYYDRNLKDIALNEHYMVDNLKFILEGFPIVSFDNLAIERLHVKDYLGEDEYNKIYMGDDGEFTFYIDLVKGIFSKSSLDIEDGRTHVIADSMTITDCFNVIRGNHVN